MATCDGRPASEATATGSWDGFGVCDPTQGGYREVEAQVPGRDRSHLVPWRLLKLARNTTVGMPVHRGSNVLLESSVAGWKCSRLKNATTEHLPYDTSGASYRRLVSSWYALTASQMQELLRMKWATASLDVEKISQFCLAPLTHSVINRVVNTNGTGSP